MTAILTRRSLLRGLFAAPAVVAVGHLMPIRGIVMAIDTAYEPFTYGRFDRFGIDREAVRELLLPGLRGVWANYESWPQTWDSFFKSATLENAA